MADPKTQTLLAQIAEDAQAARVAAEKAVRMAEGIRRRALAQTTRLRKRLDAGNATLDQLRDGLADIEAAVNADED